MEPMAMAATAPPTVAQHCRTTESQWQQVESGEKPPCISSSSNTTTVPTQSLPGFSGGRESGQAVLDCVAEEADVTLVIRRHVQAAVVMSTDTDNSLIETVHLLRSPANANP